MSGLSLRNSMSSHFRSIKEWLLHPDIFLTLIALGVFVVLRDAIQFGKGLGMMGALAAPVGVFILCLILQGPRSADVAPASRILIRVTGSMLALYAAFAPVTYPAGVSADVDFAVTTLRALSFAGLLLIPVIFLRPAFAAVPAALVLASKAIAAQAFGIDISQTDYTAVLDSALFLGLAHLLLGAWPLRFLRRRVRALAEIDVVRASTVLFIAAVAIHFSNYFYSGIQKIELEGGPFLWPFSNPTYQLAYNAQITGHLPISHLEWLAPHVIFGSQTMWPLINAATLLGQLAAIICMARRKWMILVTLFYDLTHVVIFLVTGIFFWKWIIMNLALVVAMRTLPAWVEARRIVVGGVLLVLLAPQVFYVVRLGWYDSPALVYSEVLAVTDEGTEIPVPSNFFGSFSVTAAQSRLGRVDPGHYPTVTAGTTQSADIYREAVNDCAFASEGWPFQSTADRITELVQLTHAYGLQREEAAARYRYDLFPHHIWSNPFAYSAFASLPLSEVEHYIYRTTSVCVSGEGGHPVLRVDHVDEFEIMPANAESLSRE